MKRLSYITILFFIVSTSCKQVYNPPFASPVTGYLVVEGFINSGNDASTIQLSRTVRLEDSATILYEHNARVAIEDDDNASYPLIERDSGKYVSDVLSLNHQRKYRVHIATADGKEYVSDFSPVKYTPVIDSLSWQRDNGGISIYVNANDAQKSTKYYQWKYSETWEFHSPYISFLEYVTYPVTGLGVGDRKNTDSLYTCWKTQSSTNILLGSTEKLSEDKIFLPVRYFEQNAEELSILYYIQVKQYAISREAYLFKEKLKKNTEQLGSIFDPQPSELGGNIHCISDPTEQAIGFVEVAEEQKKDIFISNEEVKPWTPEVDCAKIIIYNHRDSIKPFVQTYIPVHAVLFRGLAIVKFDAAPQICVDCRLRGTHVRPAFWPQ